MFVHIRARAHIYTCAHTYTHTPYTHTHTHTARLGTRRSRGVEWKKNRKPLYKLILGARRINTPCLPPRLPSYALYLSRSLSGLIASVEKLFSSTLMNNTNGFSARQKLLRRMRSSSPLHSFSLAHSVAPLPLGPRVRRRGGTALGGGLTASTGVKRVPANCELDARPGQYKFDQTDAFSGITNNPVQYSLFRAATSPSSYPYPLLTVHHFIYTYIVSDVAVQYSKRIYINVLRVPSLFFFFNYR